ncbi:hypothetical protein BO79DRAFT_228806 [Aspergillus costaricaensis CBS 115574]|uniref:Uncharacterized protein n=1 Tax=Aspergillus costaricaensis CBS 115574 TaxID=1448317 RepID=A0ACD1ICI9_9EURO|nr:hypothetical protein BO79DRAFT_228806 [Aspergillus costaricaensis CBS 115574]RAK88248.1 hypothetical protein BO79DRAFT_228806 [Aspergillus costaricaensis CBS 115574]
MNPAAVSKMLHDVDTTNGDSSAAFMAPDYHSFFRVRVDSKYGRSKGLPPFNETVLPDAYLATWQLAFLIRHPALTRLLYDWCVLRGGQAHPIILDASDLIHNKGAMVKFCEQMGLDPTVLKFEWDSVCAENEAWSGDNTCEQDSIFEKARITMRSTLITSSGVLKEKAPEVVDIASEAERWKLEFGDEVADFILQWVHEAMPDYEYLKQRRLV